MTAAAPARTPLGAERRRFESIPGFSDQKSMPRVAKLRLGIRVNEPGKKEHPRETDHFVLDVEDHVPAEHAKAIREKFVELYGEHAQTISNVIFISPRREDAFTSGYEWWRASKLFCHGDGNEALRKIEGRWQEWKPCANAGCPDFDTAKKQCAPQHRLRFMLPDVTMMGYFQIDTGSVYSAANIRDAFTLVESLTQAIFGAPQIHNIPFVLSRVPEDIEYQGALQKHYIVHLMPSVLSVEALKERLSRRLGAAEPIPVDRQIPAMEIPPTEEDLPVEQIPVSEQKEPEPFDKELEGRIEAGFAMLSINTGTQAALRSQFPRQADLVTELERQYKEAQARKRNGGKN